MANRQRDDVPPQIPAWTPGVDEEAMADDPSFIWEPGDLDEEA